MLAFKFFKLSWREKKTLMEAVATLYLVKILLIFFPFRSVRNWTRIARFFVTLDRAAGPSSIQAVKLGLARAQHSIVWKKSICLVNALAGQSMLSRRGIESTLNLGVTKSESKLLAHAWLTALGDDIVGAKEKNLYTRVALFDSREYRASSAENL